MKLKELQERLNSLPQDAEITVKTDGIAGPLLAYDIKAIYESLEPKETPIIEILLKIS
jgi:hypothetical protein